jgi:hypothetical protein
MTTINQLPLLTPLTSGDQVVLWSPNNGDSRRSPLSAVVAFANANPAWTGTPKYNNLNVTIGANNSGGTGFRALVVPNS